MKFVWNDKEFYIDGYLANALNSIAYNLPSDWDIVLMITGDRAVRVGKSVLAQTVAAYFAYILCLMKFKTTFGVEDIYFDSKTMMEEAQKKQKYAINVYDEGRESLAASKSMKQFQQDMVDFFTECGQLNQVFIIVAPDFFELKEYIAVGRSEILINVYRKETKIETDIFNNGTKMPIVRFDRGYFEFFDRKRKQLLYDLSRSTRKKNYNLVKATFIGKFVNQYTVDEEQYKQKKKDSLARFADRHKEEQKDKVHPTLTNLLRIIKAIPNLNATKACQRVGLDRSYLSWATKAYLKEEDDDETIEKDEDSLGNEAFEASGESILNITYRKPSKVPEMIANLHNSHNVK